MNLCYDSAELNHKIPCLYLAGIGGRWNTSRRSLLCLMLVFFGLVILRESIKLLLYVRNLTAQVNNDLLEPIVIRAFLYYMRVFSRVKINESA